MIAVIDYGVGNLFSIRSSFEKIGAEVVITSDKKIIENADRIMLPGVGAYADAAAKLRISGLGEILKTEMKKGKPIMGICLGMQLLFEKSYEYGEHEGLGILKGEVIPMKGYIDKGLKVPHIGWNGLRIERENRLLKGVETGADNITVHCLSLKSGAKLKEETSYIENDFISTMVAASRRILEENGYLPYYMYRQKYQVGNNENVGWTKPNRACVYNVDIMEETADNLAVGANAVSKRVFTDKGLITRFASQKDLKTYIEKIDEIIEKRRKFFQ